MTCKASAYYRRGLYELLRETKGRWIPGQGWCHPAFDVLFEERMREEAEDKADIIRYSLALAGGRMTHSQLKVAITSHFSILPAIEVLEFIPHVAAEPSGRGWRLELVP